MSRGEGNAKVLRFVRPAKKQQLRLAVLPNDLNHSRPATRGDCLVCPACQAWRDHGSDRTCGHGDEEAIQRSRPCVYAGCHHNLFLEVTFAGSIRLTYPGLEPDELYPSCSLDFADSPASLDGIGEALNTSRERVRQVEVSAFRKLERLLERVKEDLGG